MIGDFNADPTSLAGGMLNLFCNTNNFEQLIGEPTRITEMSCSVLDQVVTNIGHFVKEARVDPPGSSSDYCHWTKRYASTTLGIHWVCIGNVLNPAN